MRSRQISARTVFVFPSHIWADVMKGSHSSSNLETVPVMVERIVGIESDLKAWAVKKVEFSFNPAGTQLFSIHELAHSYARRSVDLAASIRLLLQEDRIIPATILGRALIETVATGCFFLHEIKRLIATGDQQRVDQRVRRFYAGVKGGEIEPVHIMDSMRHLEKIDSEYAAYLNAKFGIFAIAKEILQREGKLRTESELDTGVVSALKNYDLLSEVAHPNGTGTQFLYPDSVEPWPLADDLRHRFRDASLAAIWQGHHLLGALGNLDEITEGYRVAFVSANDESGNV